MKLVMNCVAFVVVITIVVTNVAVNCEIEKIPGMPDEAQKQLVNSTKELPRQAMKDFWGDVGKDLTNTWNTVKKVAVTVIKAVERIFGPRPAIVSFNVTETSSSSGWNGTAWNLTLKKMRIKIEEKRRERKLRSKIIYLAARNGTELKQCSGPNSFMRLNSAKTAKVCKCELGYAFNPDNLDAGCLDINECEKSKDLCGPNAECVNIDGWYDCKCLPGFTGEAVKECFKLEEANSTPTQTESKLDVASQNMIENEVSPPKESEGLIIADG